MTSRASAKRTLLTGVTLGAVGVVLMLSPYYLGVNVVSKTVVAFGLVGFLLGGSCLLNGVWDLRKTR